MTGTMSEIFGPEYDAYQVRRVAQELEKLDAMPDGALAEIIHARHVLDQIITKMRRAA